MGTQAFNSLELPDENNVANYSCIPKGSYRVVWSLSPRLKKWTYEILGVPGRAGIRIHSANFGGDDRKGWKKQLAGCVALGERVGVMDGQKAILVSKPAIRRFEVLLGRVEFILEVR